MHFQAKNTLNRNHYHTLKHYIHVCVCVYFPMHMHKFNVTSDEL
jgi:hypothetical protein